MELQTMHAQLAEKLQSHALVTATISQPRQKSNDLKRIKLKPVELKEGYRIQFEYQYEQILKHQNFPIDQANAELERLLTEFRQGLFQFTDEKVQVQLSKKFKVSYKSEAEVRAAADLSHNRKKDYLLEDGKPYPFLVRLGVQSPDGKVKKQKYDKFRQINRFIEFIDDALEHLPKDRPIRILDFGSGKSYLTFALYHYLRVEKGLDLRVTGLDLKKASSRNAKILPATSTTSSSNSLSATSTITTKIPPSIWSSHCTRVTWRQIWRLPALLNGTQASS